MANPKGNPNIAKYAPPKGTTRNPSGVSSDAQKLRVKFMSDLQKVWQSRGIVALEELNAPDLVRAVISALPKEQLIDVAHSGSVDHRHGAVSEAARLVEDLLARESGNDGTRALPH